MLGSPVAVDGPLVVWDLDAGPQFPGEMHASVARISSEDWIGMDWETYVGDLKGPDEP